VQLEKMPASRKPQPKACEKIGLGEGGPRPAPTHGKKLISTCVSASIVSPFNVAGV